MKWGQFSSDHEASNRPGMYEGGSLRGRGRALLPSLSRAHSLGRNVRARHSPLPTPNPYPTAQPGPTPVSSLLSPNRLHQPGPGEGQKIVMGAQPRRRSRGLERRGRSEAAAAWGGLLSHTHSQRTVVSPELFPSLCIDSLEGIRAGEPRGTSDGAITAPGVSHFPPLPGKETPLPISEPQARMTSGEKEGAGRPSKEVKSWDPASLFRAGDVRGDPLGLHFPVLG